ncbi:gliding motility-associated C-terminal domain-containing protein [Aquimarina sp. ERC-38]|uniref:DUF7507 domain-containing protein n=1 Tax=Aquimarina sp. ERC-38 TaxID=2949996 RepID=UPI00224656AB|nr:gliding motility-associated C-terminal domain-containing protein [Aquimarina sp. ERC-38]UZO79408.1 gliding motility-associated C-terminal domain-containing protein [Aquimarina sp. ERC-38]
MKKNTLVSFDFTRKIYLFSSLLFLFVCNLLQAQTCGVVTTLYQTEGQATTDARVLRYNPFINEYVPIGVLEGAASGSANNSAYNINTRLVYSRPPGATNNFTLRAYDPANNFEFVGSISLINVPGGTGGFNTNLFAQNNFVGRVGDNNVLLVDVSGLTLSTTATTSVDASDPSRVRIVPLNNANPGATPAFTRANDYSYLGDFIYGIRTNQLIIIDVSTNATAGNVITRAVNFDVPRAGAGFGAAWQDREGNFYAFNNNTGNIYRIADIENAVAATGLPTDQINAIRVFTAATSGTNDGFACELQADPFDWDGDTVLDDMDIDSDDDGILDTVENGGEDPSADGDGDGIPALIDDDDTDNMIGDVDGNIERRFDLDGDNIPNAFDLDSDNDGIIDNIEAQLTTGYIAPSNMDSDGDGLDDAYEPTGGITPINTDGTFTISDVLPDYLDPDSDNDGFLDTVEAYDTNGDNISEIAASGNDVDFDGLDDNFDLVNGGASNPDASDNLNQVPTDFPDDASPGNDRDWRDPSDVDNDMILDFDDLDDDNDGILDEVEYEASLDPFGDEDGDGIPNFSDSMSSGLVGDGSVTDYTDADANGIPDVYDFDGDGVPNHLDLDSDNDGIPDTVEAQNTDAPFLAYSAADANMNGLADVYENVSPTGLTPENTDADSFPDFLDTDSDNDTLSDTEEAGITLSNPLDVGINGLDANSETTDDYSDPSGTIGAPNTLPDTDGDEPNVDGDVDFRDTDSDNDGIADGTDTDPLDPNVCADADSDGCDDCSVGTDGFGPMADNLVDNDGTDDDFDGICNTTDTTFNDNDLDGVPDATDQDDDNDGILDIDEGLCELIDNSDVVNTIQTTDITQVPTNVSTNSTANSENPFPNNSAVELLYGRGVGRRLTGLEFGSGKSIESVTGVPQGTVSIRRNTVGSSNDIVWTQNDETQATNSDQGRTLFSEEFSSLEQLVSQGFTNVGTDNIFNNVSSSANNSNIERVDVVYAAGIRSSIPSSEFFLFGERGTNNTITVAAILDIDPVTEEPTSYGPPVVINTTDYAITTNSIQFTILRKEPTDATFRPFAGKLNQNVGIAFVSLADLGITSNGSVFYGYSVLPPDFNTANIVDWNSYPTDTPETIGGLDLVLFNTFFSSCTSVNDTDGDGIADSFDLDSDNDGIPDVIEAGGTDADRDGRADDADGDPTNNNGIPDTAGTGITVRDSDTDGIPDHLDIDADNDGIPDNIEGQTSDGYIDPSGQGTGITDANNNGLDDNYENGTILGIDPENTDGTDEPDYLDADSDNDGLLDIIENGDVETTVSGNDADNDGLDDVFDNNDDSGITGATVNDGTITQTTVTTIGELETAFGDEDDDFDPGTGDLNYRDTTNDLDTNDNDGDGVVDSVDLDDDNDGILDTDENCINSDIANTIGISNRNDSSIKNSNIDLTDGVDNDNIIRLDGVSITYTESGSAFVRGYDAGPQGPSIRIGGAPSDTPPDPMGSFDTELSVPIYNVRFKLTDFDDGEQFTVSIFDENGNIYDLATTDLVTVGSFISQTGNTFTSMVFTELVDDPANDNLGSLVFRIPTAVTRILLEYETTQPGGSSIRFTQLNFCLDSDGDGIPDSFDLDSDNDGITDVVEAGGTDTNNDGLADDNDGDTTNDDGIPDTAGTGITIRDSDTDGIPNHLDIDADNDGIPDNIESQTSVGYVDPSGQGTGITDVNNNGLDDNYESGTVLGIDPVNTDGTDDPDYLDDDSDNDSILDIFENGSTTNSLSGTDTDNDGLDDAFDDNDDSGINGATVNDGGNTSTTVSNATDLETAFGDEDDDFNPGTGDLDYRDSPIIIIPNDNDGDGVVDSVDLDDDNDGILDTDENCIDSDIANTIGVTDNNDSQIGNSNINTTDGVDNDNIVNINGLSITYTESGSGFVRGYNAGLQGPSIRIGGDPARTPDPSGVLNTEFSSPIYNVRFKLTDFDDMEIFTVLIYDENGTVYDLETTNFVTVGSLINQSGNTFNSTVNMEIDGNDPANDGQGSLVFDIPVAVSRIQLEYSFSKVGGSSIRFTQLNFCLDTDGDGIPDSFDLDSDNDGITDVVEVGGTDTNNDGLADDNDGDTTNDDGIPDTAGTGITVRDSDTDGIPDHLDIDADNDGIPDNIESQTSSGYIDPSGQGTGITDANNNGLDDNYESGTVLGIDPVNTDGTDDPDYLDNDSDNDSILDIFENGSATNSLSGTDTDNDGLDDAFDDNDDSGINGATVNDGGNTSTTVSNATDLETAFGDEDNDFNPGTGDLDYRDVTIPAPNLALIKTGIYEDSNANNRVDVGDEIVYTFTIENNGNVAINNITISDTLLVAPNGSITGGPITLAAGQIDSTTFSGRYSIQQLDITNNSVTNQATAIGQDITGNDVTDLSDDPDDLNNDDLDGDGDFEDLTITFLQGITDANLELIKESSFDLGADNIPNTGDVITYTFNVRNNGSVPITDIRLEDVLEGIEIDDALRIARLEPGELDNTTFTATYRINSSDLLIGRVENQATVIGKDPLGIDVSDMSDDLSDTTNIDNDSDGDFEDITITLLVPEDDIFIYTGISPNGDGQNDEFIITGLEKFENNTLRIYNRWGVLVFEEDGYATDGVENFKGISNGRVTIAEDENLPAGTYYYTLDYQVNPGSIKSRAGYLYINR